MNILLHKYVSFYVYICVLTYIRFVFDFYRPVIILVFT